MKKTIPLLLATLMVTPSGSALASLKGAFGGKSAALSEQELGDVRGGYLSAGGLLIEFGISSATLVDGIIQRDIQFGTAPGQNQDIDSSELKQVIQVGNNNAQIPQEVIDSLPDMVTIIQNSEDNKVIQNVTQMDVTVSNARVFQDGNLSSTINNATIDSLH